MQLAEQNRNLVASNRTWPMRVSGIAGLGMALLAQPYLPPQTCSWQIDENCVFPFLACWIIYGLLLWLVVRPMTVVVAFNMRQRYATLTRTALFHRWNETIPLESINSITCIKCPPLLYVARFYLKDGTTRTIAEAPFTNPEAELDIVRQDTGITGWMFS